MSSTQQVLGFAPAVSRSWRPPWGGGLRGSETAWAVAFFLPYVAVFLAFVAYPIVYGLWLGSDIEFYRGLFNDPRYLTTVGNTLLLAGIGVNVTDVPGLPAVGLLHAVRPLGQGAAGALHAALGVAGAARLPVDPLDVHRLWGFLNSVLEVLFGVDGPIWFNSYWLAMGANIVAYIWKWMPFWTLVFVAGRMAIPQDIYDAADGRRRHRPTPLHLRDLPVAREPLSRLHAALDAVDYRRFHHGVLRLQRRTGTVHRGAGHVRLPRGIRPSAIRSSAWRR